MNITYLIGVVASIIIMLLGMMGGFPPYDPTKLGNFFDPASIMIVVGCTMMVVVASFPAKTVKSLPKHFKILFNTKQNDPSYYIEQLVAMAQTARKSGLLSLEEIAKQQKNPFFQQAIMLIVDGTDADQVRSILQNDIDCMSARHEAAAAMYDRGSAVAPAFGMIGTLVGLINMLKNMSMDAGGSSSIGTDMGTALITTLYGCILAHMIFTPIASNLRTRDEEEVLCKLVIVEGIICILGGDNPKFLRERLLTFVSQKQRESNIAGDASPKEAKGKKQKKKA
ncbi:MAG: MotA/TolQ/ExbB proton channel family protein [Lawsonibacter sp.]|nr:MotA/TolQ/ExbB proton channel family protein [Lawsonibacter sp.]